MVPDNQWLVPSGLFEAECLVDGSRYGADVSRMITIYRWLRVLPADAPCPGTIGYEQGTSDLEEEMEAPGCSRRMSPTPLSNGEGLLIKKMGELEK